MTVFWDVVPCSLVEVTDVSEVLAASIIRAIYCIFIFANRIEITKFIKLLHKLNQM
jgi:hypothetical protein